ncbi:hypothetical protein PV387_36750 [Streptomyces sp. ME02-6987-2C]|uniref:hypothetical protein n=1 Tax=unclassified Streptomyces TaxID=2593676 RepID=UPI0029AB4647|nr:MULTISPECIES: hypothetical protein [unclassified Streptomyces]MDX3371488.1 hypothetical protein [Streptomyces sp. ME02-6987-2C]MDX3427125.1 hypothetical protein [Streptomyces sp. ME02-6985-2c]
MDRAGTPADESARRIAALYAPPGQDTFTIDGLGLDHEDRTTPLARHPRKLDVWGLHVQALPESAREASPLPSTATPARGTLQDVAILDQPGLPMAVSWNIAAIPPVALLVYLGSGRRRDNPAHRVTTSSGLPPCPVRTAYPITHLCQQPDSKVDEAVALGDRRSSPLALPAQVSASALTEPG